ncbi:uncharacterized protein LOC116288341 [Actinia tenebrosa]|uniref:Uncharacterized protein LOC116288341 n=1 Tax=Actinia tenebrosa TaxID=6105 RepID=A0A6P8HEH1_ACTTE|nr:uncharacterized protein LOC116288341 [Actinia tenebrosa]
MFLMTMRMMVCLLGYRGCYSTIIVPPNVKNDTRSLIGYTNGSIEIGCDVNASDWFTWTKDSDVLGRGERIMMSRDGRLIFNTLYKNDSGVYTCIAGLNMTRGKNITLLVVDKTRLPVVKVLASSSQLPVTSYTLPEWMISVACVVVIALVTIIIIITYVNMSRPKRDISSHANVEMSDVTEETIEVVTFKKSAEKSHDEDCKISNHGKVRQRKSSSSPTQDSCSIENEWLQEKSASKKKREEKKKESEGKGWLCTVEYVEEIPVKLRLSEGNKTGQNVKIKSEYRRSAEKSFAASDVRSSLEKTTMKEDVRRDEEQSNCGQERLSGSGNAHVKKQLNSAFLPTKFPPKKPEVAEPMKKIDSKPGQALRKIISDPCLMNRPPFLAAHTRINNIGQDSATTAQGQGLRRITSEPIRMDDTIYSAPIIKGSLKLDKKSLKELKSKIQKSKSPAEIHRHKLESKREKNRDKKLSPATISFTNEIYGSIEELRAPENEQPKTTVFEETETEPIYEVIQERIEKDVGEGKKCKNKKAGIKEVKDSLQNTKGNSSRTKNTKKGCSKISKQEYEPRKLDFAQGLSDDGARLRQFSVSTKDEESHEEHEKCFENLSFSILEDLEKFDEDFDEEPNKVVDGIYQDVEDESSKLTETLNQTTESLYEEIHFSSTVSCQDEYEELNELS